jgi:radical SAM superfamily enzyme YgiQ (UPF0313 family)
MKILLINSNRYKLTLLTMPYGVCCVAASLENAGHEVHVLDLCFSKNCKRDIREALGRFQPDIVGVGIRNIDSAAPHNILFLLDPVKSDVIDPLKQAFSGPIVIGGAAVGVSGVEMLSFFDLEYAIRGDGEYAMVEFVDRMEKRLPLVGLKGLIWRKENEIVEDNQPYRVPDLNSLPLVRIHRYIDIKPYTKYKIPIPIQTKRGCVLECAYCTYRTLEGRTMRLKDPELIADEIQSLVKETGVENVEFVDSVFNIPLEHSKAVLRAIKSRNLQIRLQTMGFNPSAIDEELVDLLVENNLKEFHISVESGSNIILRNLGKNFTKSDIIKATQLLSNKGISILWDLLTGAPGETKETLMETFETLTKSVSKWDLIVVGNGIRLYKGAPLSERIFQSNPKCTDDNFLHPVTFLPQSMDLETMRAFNKTIAFKHPNIFFYDEIQRLPFFVVKFQNWLMQTVAPHKTWWKLFIFINHVMRVTGINFIRRVIFEFKNRHILPKTFDGTLVYEQGALSS